MGSEKRATAPPIAKTTRKSTGKDSPSPRLRFRLDTLDDVRAEAARVYREARGGKIGVGEAKAFAYLLQVLSVLTKESTLEARIAALEEGIKP